MKRLSLMLLAMALAGCQDSSIGIVSGTVTVDGSQAGDGSIVFAPLDGKHGPAGGPIVDGTYSVTVPVGPSKVEIRLPVVVGQIRIYGTKDSPIQDDMRDSLPPKYNDETELTYDVPAGKSEKNFDLSIKK